MATRRVALASSTLPISDGRRTGELMRRVAETMWSVDWVLTRTRRHPTSVVPAPPARTWKKRHAMSVNRTHRESNGEIPVRSSHSATPAAADTVTPPAPEPTPQPAPPVRMRPTRTGAAWVALAVAALLAVLLIIFLVQNTRSIEISFLWMTATTPLAVALLIAAVGSVLLTLILGTARIAQLRRLVRKQRD